MNALDQAGKTCEPAHSEFISEHAPAVLRFCLGRLRDRHLAEDAAQEAFLRWSQAVRRGEVPRDSFTWLLGVARRCCQEVARRRRRDGGVVFEEAEHAVGSEALAAPDEPDVAAALEALTDAEQALVRWRHTDGLRCREIAERLGRPLGSVTAQLARAYAKLRPRLAVENDA